MLNNDVTYFDSFGVEHIPKEIRAFIGNKYIKTNIFRIQGYDSIMRGYFCIRFIDFMPAGKTLTKFTNLFSPNNFKKNDDIILKHFKTNVLKIDVNEVIKHNKIINNSLKRKYKMKSYCLKSRKDTENIYPKVSGTSNGKAMLSKCAICSNKKSRFIKN